MVLRMPHKRLASLRLGGQINFRESFHPRMLLKFSFWARCVAIFGFISGPFWFFKTSALTHAKYFFSFMSDDKYPPFFFFPLNLDLFFIFIYRMKFTSQRCKEISKVLVRRAKLQDCLISVNLTSPGFRTHKIILITDGINMLLKVSKRQSDIPMDLFPT